MEELLEIDRASDALLRIYGNLEMSGPRWRVWGGKIIYCTAFA
jgi:hypothetical protein